MDEIAQTSEIHNATVSRIVKMTDNFWEMGDLTQYCSTTVLLFGLHAKCLIFLVFVAVLPVTAWHTVASG